jgi:hypothetical protein
LIGIIHLHVGTDGAGVRKRQPDCKSSARRRIVERKNLERVVFLDNDDAGVIDWLVPSPLVGEG